MARGAQRDFHHHAKPLVSRRVSHRNAVRTLASPGNISKDLQDERVGFFCIRRKPEPALQTATQADCRGGGIGKHKGLECGTCWLARESPAFSAALEMHLQHSTTGGSIDP